jgi:hypothetical protein
MSNCVRVGQRGVPFFSRRGGCRYPVRPELGCASIRCKTEVVQLVAEQVMADLQPWIEQEKAKHVRRIVNMAKRGFERIEKVWDENEPCSPKAESLAAATLDKHDAIIRRNLGMNETPAGSCSLNLHVLTGARTIIEAQQSTGQSGAVVPEKTTSQEPSS